MSVNLAVTATVFDLRGDSPKETDLFLVDSQVWYWTHYSRASQAPRIPARYQTRYYPEYVKRTIENKAKLFRCELSLSELATVIERCEYDIFIAAGGAMDRKEFRHNLATERTQVVEQVGEVWAAVEACSEQLSKNIDGTISADVLTLLKNAKLDGHDALIVEIMRRNGLHNLVTDDKDLATVAGINIFTANPQIIDPAREQGALQTR